LLALYQSTSPNVNPAMTADGSIESFDLGWVDSTKAQFARIAANTGAAPATGYVVDSIDYSQLTVKNLWGNTVLREIAALLQSVSGADAATAKQNWDRAFGLSGFAPDALTYTKEQMAATLKQKDTDNDGTLARRWETNFIFAHYAMRMDAEASWGGNFPAEEQFHFTRDLMRSFIDGRIALNEGRTNDAVSEASKIIAKYEVLVVGAIQHYLRVHQPFISSPAEQGLTGKRISNWSETLAFVNILEKIPGRKISAAQLRDLRASFGHNPFAMDETDRVNARNLLQTIYGFRAYQFNNI